MFGLVFGSFANVVIWRFPRGENLSHPDSHCPACDTPILWRDNIPVASWFLLHGRCRSCGAAISSRYPIVETMSGLLWLAAGWRFGLSVQAGFAIVFFYLLLILTWIDLDTMRLPNRLVGLLALFGIGGAALSQFTTIAAAPLVGRSIGFSASPLVIALVGALMTALPAFLLSLVMSAVLKRPALGMGDVKLLAVFGLFLGAYGLLAFFLGSFIGVVWGIVAQARLHGDGLHGASERESATPNDIDSEDRVMHDEVSDAPAEAAASPAPSSPFPFGPALAIGAVVVTLYGPQLWVWYQTLFTV